MTDDREMLQCEQCGVLVTEAEATMEEYPGATLSFCGKCTEPPKHKQYGVHP